MYLDTSINYLIHPHLPSIYRTQKRWLPGGSISLPDNVFICSGANMQYHANICDMRELVSSTYYLVGKL